MTAEHKLALGTVQFGLPYGIANKAGQVPGEEARAILQFARTTGIDTLDTAVGYGNSETVLGDIGVEHFKVITKLPEFNGHAKDIGTWMREEIQASKRRLRQKRLQGVLLHRPAQLHAPFGHALYAELCALKEAGEVCQIGISIYEPSELDSLIPNHQFDLVQSPLNIFDRRLIETGWARRLHDKGIEIHARSTFLQGLLLMPATARPKKFERFAPVLRAWDDWLERTRQSPLDACIGYVASHPEISRIVVGVDSADHLKEIVIAAQTAYSERPDWSSPTDPLLLNPAHWNSL
ncbi:aldo/keto reductase [Propionivibrio dicarboxylicus]|uniref:NADP-dependent oxidoreductase domain-containing protein n=1 Tax=Propionivibrio dicarboxylicus TaxID=83767 RepID=A0A1G8DWG9_9RHOO|nr:aldo/keto reductase [Propionivibrio dicarboxylicus]SDH62066.1 hypothetical protein SAMN05660652_01967 [Propionivibrio dicarboxylicus]